MIVGVNNHGVQVVLKTSVPTEVAANQGTLAAPDDGAVGRGAAREARQTGTRRASCSHLLDVAIPIHNDGVQSIREVRTPDCLSQISPDHVVVSDRAAVHEGRCRRSGPRDSGNGYKLYMLGGVD